MGMSKPMTFDAKGNQFIEIAIPAVIKNVVHMVMAFAFRFLANATFKTIAFSNLILEKGGKCIIIRIGLNTAFPAIVFWPHVFSDMGFRIFYPSLKFMSLPIKWIIGAAHRIFLFPSISKRRMILAKYATHWTRFAEKIILFSSVKFRMQDAKFGPILSRFHIGPPFFRFWFSKFDIYFRPMHSRSNCCNNFQPMFGTLPHLFSCTLMTKATLRTTLCWLSALQAFVFVHFTFPSKGYYARIPIWRQGEIYGG